MAVDRDQLLERNHAALGRLRAVLGRLGDADLSRPLGYGWTVSSALVHLAFWDRRTLLVLERLERDGAIPFEYDPNIINDAMLPLALAIPPRRAAEEALSTAEVLHRKLDMVSQETLDTITTTKAPIRVDRSAHYTVHLDEIERVLAG